MSERGGETIGALGRRIVAEVAAEEAGLFPVSERQFFTDAGIRRATTRAVLAGERRDGALEFGAAEGAQLVVDVLLVVLNGLATQVLVDAARHRLRPVRRWRLRGPWLPGSWLRGSWLRGWRLRRRLATEAAPAGPAATVPKARDSVEAHLIGEYIRQVALDAKLTPQVAQHMATTVTAAITPPLP